MLVQHLFHTKPLYEKVPNNKINTVYKGAEGMRENSNGQGELIH